MANYFLHVDVTLNDRTKNAARFEELVRQFLAEGAFGTDALTPRLLLKATSRTPAAASPDYVNLWVVKSLADLDLATVMNNSRDNLVYEELNALVAVEGQEFVFPDEQVDQRNAAKAPARPGTGTSRFVRVTHQFPDSATYGTYAVTIISMAIYVENSGWNSAGVFWNVTGRLNTFTEFWSVPGATDEKLQTMLDAAKKGGAPRDLLDAYASCPQTSRILFTEYAMPIVGNNPRAHAPAKGAK